VAPALDIRRSIAMKNVRCAMLGAFLALSTASFAGPGAHGPNGEHLDAPGAPVNASGLARLPDGSVNVPKLAQRRMGIRTAMPALEDAAATIELPGRVIMNPNAGGRVQASHGGRLEAGPKGFPVLGQGVHKGEILVYTRHHADPFAQANQQAQLTELRANRTIAEQRVQRLASLEGTVPRKDIDAARAELQSLLERERDIGSSVHAREPMVAPVSGVIARADAIAGQVVETGHVLFEIVDPRQLMVEATTTDPTIASRIGAAGLQGVPEARLKLLGAARSLREGVLPITFEASAVEKAKGLPLAVGQPVTVIATLTERVKGIVLPAQAVVRNAANEPIVWIKSGAERYIPQPVQYAPLDARSVVVTAGLGVDNRIVVQGAPLIAQIR
jgi:cobalt-zinc-cadmium efflux system membrane fusion protein